MFVIGVGLYIAQVNISKAEQKLNESLDKVAKVLPTNVSQQNVLTKGLFSSTGIYKLSYVEDGKTDSLVVNYELKHGIGSWFGGDMGFHSTSRLEGELAKSIEASPTDSMVMNGVVKSDGSFDLKGKGSKVTVNVESESSPGKIIIHESTSSITYNKSTGEVKSEMSYPLVNIDGKKEKLDLKNIYLSRNFNMNEPELGDFSFKIEEVANKIFMVKGIDVLANAIIKDNKLNVVTSLKAADISAPSLGQKDVSVEFSYSIKGLDKSIVDIYKQALTDSDAKLSEEESDKLFVKVKEILKVGGILSLDKFNIKSPQGNVSLSGAVELKPVQKVEDISFAKNTKLSTDLLVDGDYAKLLLTFAPPSDENVFMIEGEKVKMSILFDNSVFLLNGQQMPEIYAEQMNEKLREIDENFKQIK